MNFGLDRGVEQVPRPEFKVREMPLGRKDADRGLGLLREFYEEIKNEDEQALSVYEEAIASLDAYLTNLLPASQPSLQAKVKGGLQEIHPHCEAPIRVVNLHCKLGEKLGVSIESVSLNEWGSSEVSPFFISSVKPGSAAEKEGTLRRGDQVMEVNRCPMAQVSQERAR